MATDTYAIVFKGETLPGFDQGVVQAQLSKMLKIDAKKAAALFSGKQIVLKKTADKQIAAKYGKALKQAGADVKVRIVKAEAAAPTPQSTPKPAAPVFEKAEAPVFQPADDAPAFEKADPEPAAPAPAAAPPPPEPAGEAAPAAIDTSGISLAPNEGNIVEPSPEVPAPDLDLSGISVAENDGTPLVEPSEEVIVEMDLSEFSVSENDGSPLVEASQEEIPEVDVPDFGLDEPGAILETIQEEKELLNPNTVGMTLAMTGSDLIEEDEKPPAPPPVAPDTSKINLVPNFDI